MTFYLYSHIKHAEFSTTIILISWIKYNCNLLLFLFYQSSLIVVDLIALKYHCVFLVCFFSCLLKQTLIKMALPLFIGKIITLVITHNSHTYTM